MAYKIHFFPGHLLGLTLLSFAATATGALAQQQPDRSQGRIEARSQCGGDFESFLDGVRREALSRGLSAGAVDAAIADMHLDEKVLAADNAQGVFAQTWKEFATRMVNGYRLKQGRANLSKYADSSTAFLPRPACQVL